MRFILVVFLLLTSNLIHSQAFEVDSFFSETTENGTIEGIVFDTETINEPLSFADITVKDTTISATSNIDGSFSMNLKPGTYTLIFSFIGYQSIEIPNVVVASNNTTKLNPELAALQVNTDISLNNLSDKL